MIVIMATPDKNKKLYSPEVNDMAGELYGDLEKAYTVGVQDAASTIDGMPKPPSFQTIEVTAPNKPVSDYQYNQNLINSILKEPMDAATEEKRARSAYAIGSIGALGNAFSAFSNLAFTGQGAPSQTLPTLPDTYGLVKDMQDRNQKDRDNYLRYKTAARNADRSEWAQDQQLYGQQIDRKNNLAKSQYEIDSNRYKWGVEQQQRMGAQAENRAKNAYDAAANEKRHQETLAESRANRVQSASQFKQQMDLKEKELQTRETIAALKNHTLGSVQTKMQVPSGNGHTQLSYVNVDWGKIPDTEYLLYTRLPESIRSNYDYAIEEAKNDVKKRAKLVHDAVVDGLANDSTFSAQAYNELASVNFGRTDSAPSMPGVSSAPALTMPGVKN